MPESKFEPDYDTKCENCGQVPTVTLVKNGVLDTHWEMCGPCVFGTAKTLDESTWNNGEY